MSPSGLHVNKPLVFVVIGLVGGFVVWYKFFSGSSSPSVSADGLQAQQGKDENGQEAVKNIQAALPETKVIKVQELDVSISYLEVSPEQPKFDVLFLHGAAFSAETWIKDPPQTLQLMKTLGYRAVAIDLPIKGKSTESKLDNGKYLAGVIKALKLDKPVIVSPSMSGTYSLPYLFEDAASVMSRARGYIPVAPTSTEKYTDKYKDAQIPTLIIYGENDTGLGEESLKNFKSLPKKTIVKIPGADHACYMHNSVEFNTALTEFLQTLE